MKSLTLPSELQLLIASGIGYLVTEGLKGLSNLFGKDISGVASVITAAVVTALVTFIETLLNVVPEEYQAATGAALGLLVAILGAFGIHRQFKRA